MRTIWIAIAAFSLLAVPVIAAEDVLFSQDFEGADAAATLTNKLSEVVTPGAGTSKHCAKTSMQGIYATFYFKPDVRATGEMHLDFDYKTEVRAGTAGYVGISVILGDKKKSLFSTIKPSTDWKHAEINLSALTRGSLDGKSRNDLKLEEGEKIVEIRVFSRGKDKTADHTLWLDNVKITSKNNIQEL